MYYATTWLVQLKKYWSAELEETGSYPSQTSNQGL